MTLLRARCPGDRPGEAASLCDQAVAVHLRDAVLRACLQHGRSVQGATGHVAEHDVLVAALSATDAYSIEKSAAAG